MKTKTPSCHFFVPREMRRKNRAKSQTPGNKKNDYCQLRHVGGQPRKAWLKSRSYKMKNYHVWCKFGDNAHGK